MAWIPVEQDLPRHRKTLELAELLGKRSRRIHPYYLVGLLHQVWGWAVNACPSGRIGDIPSERIAKAVGWRDNGDTLLEALRTAGFVCTKGSCGGRSDHEEGMIHDWFEEGHAGWMVRKRERERIKKRAQRGGTARAATAEREPSGAYVPRDVAGTGEGHVRSVPRDANAVSPAIRTNEVDIRTNPPISPHRGTRDSRAATSPFGDLVSQGNRIVTEATESWRRVLARLQDTMPPERFVELFRGSELVMGPGEGVFTVYARDGRALEAIAPRLDKLRSAIASSVEEATRRQWRDLGPAYPLVRVAVNDEPPVLEPRGGTPP